MTLGANGAFGAIKKGGLFVDHTTASASIARELAVEAEKRGFDFVDAPVSGGQAGAVNGKLGIMCGGSEAGYARAEPVMACTQSWPSGSVRPDRTTQQDGKSDMHGRHRQGMAEAYSLMRAAGLDIEAVTEVISEGAAQSWQMENRMQDHERGRVSITVRRRMDAQGFEYRAGGGPQTGRQPAR